MLYLILCVAGLMVFLAWTCSDSTSDKVSDRAVLIYGVLLAAAFLLLPVWV